MLLSMFDIAHFCTMYMFCATHLFSRARKKGFSLFSCGATPSRLWGDPVQNRPQNPAPAGCHFSTTKSRSEVPDRGDFGEENCVGKGGADKAKKRKKGCAKEGGERLGLTLTTQTPLIQGVEFHPLN